MRQEFAQLGPRLAVLRKLAGRAEQLRVRLDEREPLPLHVGLGDHLPVQLAQFGLVVEQIELARPARHEQEDDRLGLRLVMQPATPRCESGRRRLGRGRSSVGHQRTEGHRAETDLAIVEEVAASDLAQQALFAGVIEHGLSLFQGGSQRGTSSLLKNCSLDALVRAISNGKRTDEGVHPTAISPAAR